MKMSARDVVDIEQILDRNNMADVLQALIDISHGKAEHLRSNWQDNKAARNWEAAAKVLDSAMMRDAIQRLP